ncbi:MAG: alpha/beta hydrolase-fold protein [Sediminibacterium sp.]
MAQENFNIKIKIEVSDAVKKSFKSGGRLLFHLTSQSEKEPRSNSEVTIGYTPENWNIGKSFTINTKHKNVLINGVKKLAGHLGQKYYYQVVYKQNETDGNENVEGNLYSEVDSLILTNNANVQLTLKSIIPANVIIDHPNVKTVTITSKYLSDFFGTPRQIKASILLPSGYFKSPTKNYPICYRAPGLNGRFTAINNMMGRKEFTNWWFSSDAPQVIYVFLDSQGPFGDTYQVDSENNGPCGKALTEELIPAIEKLVQYNPASKKRYVVGASTGGWVAMGLQIFYPDFFDGAWSYLTDTLEFELYCLIVIYQ